MMIMSLIHNNSNNNHTPVSMVMDDHDYAGVAAAAPMDACSSPPKSDYHHLMSAEVTTLAYNGDYVDPGASYTLIDGNEEQQERFVQLNHHYFGSLLSPSSIETITSRIMSHQMSDDDEDNEEDDPNVLCPEYQSLVDKCSILSQVMNMYKSAFLTNGQDESPVDDILTNFVIHHNYRIYALLVPPSPSSPLSQSEQDGEQQEQEKVSAFAIVSMLNENEMFCHLDYISVHESCRGNGTGSRFMKQFLIPHLTHQRHVTLECETRLVGWYSKLGAKKLPILDSIFAGRRFVFMYFESMNANHQIRMMMMMMGGGGTDGGDHDHGHHEQNDNNGCSESYITSALAQKVMGELRVKFHDLHVMNTVHSGDDVYCTWE